jgi:hypothetical protein
MSMQRRFAMTATIGNTASQFQLARLFFGVLPPSRSSASGTSAAATGGTSSSDPTVRSTLSAQARLASLLVLPDDVAKSLAEDQKTAADLLAALDQAKKSMANDRKGEALEKLNRARKKLELLRMFGGDPKAVAREAKRIAEEIRAAAGEYAAALKSEGGGNVPATDSVAVGASPSATPAPPGQGVVHVPGVADAGEAGAKPADAPAKDAAPAIVETADPEAARQQTVQAYQDAAARVAAQANKDRGEREVLAQFEDAAREVKRLIEDAVRKLKAKNPSDPDARDAERAKAAIDEEIKELSDTIQAQRDGSATDVFVGAVAGIATAGAAAPVVDILT